jgi:beta-galactosidase
MRLGTCYYPEQWPQEWWADDARRMAEMGLTRVRIGEFAWSRIEPEAGRFDWAWLDQAVETLHAAGLGIIMGTPTATPPKWLVDQMPDMVAIDAAGKPRGFGSRRHYCFSHGGYRAEAARITRALVERYGDHPAIVAWQTDNEFGCHDTVLSYSPAAASAFRVWLAARYRSVVALNTAWGTVFWSQEYRTFAEIDPPHLTVTEANPAHLLDYQRFSSDQVVSFNRAQVDILRTGSPGRDVVHNFMGFFTAFDHHDVGRDLDVSTWDSYPLGFLEQFWFSDADKLTFARTGHPDIAAFHHDLYRGCSNGRWWVMEQQPGPVNWSRFNPAPLPGMVRLWTLEAMAHGAELVSYFRWRQAPFAQEQMHAGLLGPDRIDDVGAHEARDAFADILEVGALGVPPKSVALVFSYDSDWVTTIQPQGQGFSALRLCFEFYTALRLLGLDVDIVSPEAALDGYAMIVVPCLPILPDGFVDRLAALTCPVLIGPRSGSKTADFQIPPLLPPGDLQSLVPLKVVRVESLRPGLVGQGEGFTISRWLEYIESEVPAEDRLMSGRGTTFKSGTVRYLAAWPDPALLSQVLARMTGEAALATHSLPETLRLRRAGDYVFAFNYGSAPLNLSDTFPDLGQFSFVLGDQRLPAAGVAAWRASSDAPSRNATQFNVVAEDGRLLCPACGYVGAFQANAPPYVERGPLIGRGICDCCHWEPGFDDDPGASAAALPTICASLLAYRANWVASAYPWGKTSDAAPLDYDGAQQLKELRRLAPHLA